jgi:transcriptional regulator with XRE-family HTH domain
MRGRERSAYLARRIGTALRDARRRAGLAQWQMGAMAGISQSFVSRIERGRGSTASLETLAACAAAVGHQLAAFVELAPGADPPRDVEHVRRQDLVVRLAGEGGWTARPEHPIDPDAARSRSIDVLLQRPVAREAAVLEIVDLLTDVGAEMRELADKVAAIRRELGDSWTVRGLLVLRATRGNRRVVGAAPALFDARFSASGRSWMTALRSDARLPAADGLLWTSVRGDRIFPARRVHGIGARRARGPGAPVGG